MPGTLLSRDMRYREVAACETISTVSNSAVAVVLAWGGFSFWRIVYAHLASDLARTAARSYFARWRPSRRFSRSAFRELSSFGAGIYGKNLLDYTAGNIDNLIVGRSLGMSALGIYDKAFRLMSNWLRESVSLARGHHFESLVGSGGARALPSRVSPGRNSGDDGGIPDFTGLILVAPELFRVLFGPAWMDAVLPFQILCAAGMLRLLNWYQAARRKPRE